MRGILRCDAAPPPLGIGGRKHIDWPIELSEPLQTSLGILLEAHQYARDVGRSDWDFAIEIERLLEAGLSESDLRWLVCKGYIEHGSETTRCGEARRSFRVFTTLKYQPASCFAITEEGVAVARHLAQANLTGSNAPRVAPQSPSDNGTADCVIAPCWDAASRELRVGGRVVKRYRVPAPNQEVVLAAFEEEDWPDRIDDPLPPVAEIEPKRRLHSTIQCLNRNQRSRLVRFRGDGNGQGVRWELLAIQKLSVPIRCIQSASTVRVDDARRIHHISRAKTSK